VSTATPQLAAPASPPKAPAQISTNPYVGVLGVFLGASIATMNSRLLSVGLADLRGAIGISFDEASWLPTALNMAMMFSGVFCVFVSARLGPRRILLFAASLFMITSILLPFSPNFWVMLALDFLARRHRHALHAALRVLRYSPPQPVRPRSKLARICLFQLEPQPDLRSS